MNWRQSFGRGIKSVSLAQLEEDLDLLLGEYLGASFLIRGFRFLEATQYAGDFLHMPNLA